MKRTGFLLLLLAIATVGFTAPTDNKYLVTENQFGPITAATTYADLVKLFGKNKIADETRTGAEGEGEYKCTVINKNTPQEITVFWVDNKLHGKIAGAETTQLKGPYYTADSLKVGSTLTDLVKANKAFITFFGFAWDYGGTITSFHKGKYDNSKIGFGIDWKPKGNDSALMGDGEFNSNMPKVKQRATQIRIYKLEVSFSG